MEQDRGGGRGQLPAHRRVPDRRADRARSRRQQRERRVLEHHRQARVHAVGSVAGIHARRLFLRGPEQREDRRSERHALDDRQRRHPRPVRGRERSAGAVVRRRAAGALQLPRRHQRRNDAQHRPAGDRSASADQRRRRHDAVEQGVRQQERVQRRFRRAARDGREPGRRLRCCGGDHAVPGRLSCQSDVRDAGGDAVDAAILGRHATEHGRLRAGHLHAHRQAGADAQRAHRPLEQHRRSHQRDRRRNRIAGSEQQTVDRCQERHGRQPACGRHVSRHRQGERVGRGQLGFPRADADRAVSPVLGRRGHDASERSARARASGWRRSGRQRRAGAQRDRSVHVVRQSRERSGVERHTESDDGAETEHSRDRGEGRADRRRGPRRCALAAGGRLRVR